MLKPQDAFSKCTVTYLTPFSSHKGRQVADWEARENFFNKVSLPPLDKIIFVQAVNLFLNLSSIGPSLRQTQTFHLAMNPIFMKEASQSTS